MNKADECDLLLSDLIEAYDESFNPIHLENEKKHSELIKLESLLREARDSKDKNTRRVVLTVSAGVVSVTLGYFAFRNIKSAFSASSIADPTKLPIYWRVLMGAGAVGSGVYGFTQGRDFFLTNKQVKEGLAAVEIAKAEFNTIQAKLNEKMCEANELIRDELEANQCASVGIEHFQCF